MQWGRSRFALVDVAQGTHHVVLASQGIPFGSPNGIEKLGNPTMNSWKVITDFFPTVRGSAKHTVYQRDGRNCLEIGGKSGAFMLTTHTLHGMPRLNPEGLRFWLYGRGRPDRVTVTVGSDQWHYHLDANFKGWRQFRLTREDFDPRGAWDQVQYVTFSYTNAGPAPGEPEGIVFADLCFLPSRKEKESLPQIEKGEAKPFRTWNYMPTQ